MAERIICFDTETTGFEYAKGDRIIEIGAVELIDGKITARSFHEYVNPDGKIIPPDSYAVHKISNEFLSDKPNMRAVAPRFLEFIGNDSIIVAHNGSGFDFPFINHELAQLNLPQIPAARQVDSIMLASAKVFGPKNYTLDALAKWFGISLSARADAHGALIDAEILARVYLAIEQQGPAESIEETMAREHAAMLTIPKPGAAFPRRSFPPKPEELEKFNEFINREIKSPMWLS
jgi:DNA polymerase-3 subunit epsilon